jgi:hypothetical protein
MDVPIDTEAGIFFFIVAMLWGLFVTLFWMVVGWRAMRAHEKIAGELRRYVGEESRIPAEGTIDTPAYECSKCNMISKTITTQGQCPHCGAKVDRS